MVHSPAEAVIISPRTDSKFALSQWETALLCNALSHWLGSNLESALSPGSSSQDKNIQYDIVYLRIQQVWYLIWNPEVKVLLTDYIGGLVQERCNSIADTLGLCLLCANPSIKVNKNLLYAAWLLRAHARKQCHKVMILSHHPSDTIWPQRTRSTLARVIMDYCLKSLSHCLNQCWLLISEVLRFRV